jgi:hypothetical protein
LRRLRCVRCEDEPFGEPIGSPTPIPDPLHLMIDMTLDAGCTPASFDE